MEIGDFTQVVTTYDAVAVDYAARLPTTEPEDVLDLAMTDHFVARLGPTPTVLDAGCGTGRISRYLADRGCRVIGLDLSPGMVAVARRDHPDLAFEVGSIVDLPYADASVDAALYWYSVIHSPGALGHDVTLTRFHRPVDQMADELTAAGFRMVAHLSREPVDGEKDPQAFMIATRQPA